MLRWPPQQQRVQIVDGLVAQAVLTVDDRFEYRLLFQGFDHLGETLACDATLVEKDLLELRVVEALDGFGEASLAAVVQRVLLQAERQRLDLLQNRHDYFMACKARAEKFDLRVVRLENSLADVCDLLLLPDIILLELVQKVRAHLVHGQRLLVQLAVEDADFLRLLVRVRLRVGLLTMLKATISSNIVHLLLDALADLGLEHVPELALDEQLTEDEGRRVQVLLVLGDLEGAVALGRRLLAEDGGAVAEVADVAVRGVAAAELALRLAHLEVFDSHAALRRPVLPRHFCLQSLLFVNQLSIVIVMQSTHCWDVELGSANHFLSSPAL